MSGTNNQLKIGAVLSYINLALSCVIPMTYTPIMLRILGDAEYGVYALATSTIGYLSLLTFGFGNTILRYLSMYRANQEKEKERSILGFFLLLYSGIAVLILLGALIISANVEGIFQQGLTGAEMEKMQVLILIMGFSSAISLPNSVYYSLAMAHEKYVFRKTLDIVLNVAAPVGNLIALYLGYTSIGMAIVGVVIQSLTLPINLIYCLKNIKVKPKICRLPKGMVREMMGFSAYVFLGTLVDMLFWSTDKVLLGMFASSSAVAVYNIGGTFNNMVLNLSGTMSNLLTPRVTAMVTTDGDHRKISDLFIRVGRLQYILVALIVSGFAVFGQIFIELWAGETYSASYWIAVITLFPMCISLIQTLGVSIITAQNKHRFRSTMYFIVAVVNVVTTYLVIPRWGGVGAAVCSGVSYLIGEGAIMNIYYYKVTKIDIPLFWKNIFKMSLVPAGLFFAGIFVVRHVEFGGWIPFFAGVILYSAVYVVLMYLIAFDSYEKNIVNSVLRKVMKKCN